MLSDHLKKIDRTSSRNLFLIASVLVIVCQLVAMALVAGSQVQRAELRESRLTARTLPWRNVWRPVCVLIARPACFSSQIRTSHPQSPQAWRWTSPQA